MLLTTILYCLTRTVWRILHPRTQHIYDCPRFLRLVASPDLAVLRLVSQASHTRDAPRSCSHSEHQKIPLHARGMERNPGTCRKTPLSTGDLRDPCCYSERSMIETVPAGSREQGLVPKQKKHVEEGQDEGAGGSEGWRKGGRRNPFDVEESSSAIQSLGCSMQHWKFYASSPQQLLRVHSGVRGFFN